MSGYVPLTGKRLFEFDTFDLWVRKAKQWYGGCGYPSKMLIAIDAKQRICRIGKHFMQARDDGAFPVRVCLQRHDEDADRLLDSKANNQKGE